MSFEKRLGEVILQADSDLRDLLQQAIEAGDYRAVSRIAEAADRVSNALSNEQDEAPAKPEAAFAPRSVAQATMESVPRPMRPAYPRFERDGEKLIKVGWSKKDRREYEHRAPKDAVTRTLSRLAKDAGLVFTMDDILPVSGDNGADVPSYQVYLALAWFRDLGLVQKKGKDGYTIKEGLDWQAVEPFWQGLNAR